MTPRALRTARLQWSHATLCRALSPTMVDALLRICQYDRSWYATSPLAVRDPTWVALFERGLVRLQFGGIERKVHTARITPAGLAVVAAHYWGLRFE